MAMATRGFILFSTAILASGFNTSHGHNYRLFEDTASCVSRHVIESLRLSVPASLPEIVALPSSVCSAKRAGHLLQISGYRTGDICNIAAGPLLLRPDVPQPAAHRHAATQQYRALDMSVALLDYFLTYPNFTVYIVAGLPAVTLCAPGHPENFTPYSWARAVPGKDVYASHTNTTQLFPALYTLAWLHNFRAIVEPNKAIAWLTCARNAKSCVQEDPSALPTQGEPPCCAAMLTRQLLLFDDLRRELGFQLFLDAGTLLGAFRNGKVLPHTNDNDIIVPRLRQDRRKYMELFARVEIASKFEYFAAFDTLFQSEPYRSRPSSLTTSQLQTLQRRLHWMPPILNLFWMGAMTQVLDKGRPTQLIDRCRWVVKLEGREFCSAGEPESTLKSMYGPDFSKPDQSFERTGMTECMWPLVRGCNEKDPKLALNKPHDSAAIVDMHRRLTRQRRKGFRLGVCFIRSLCI
eukprot:TRINITY_DN56542_c0_g1_i1.p1 TRINITY_DN56542_c0_g1~~TRINITY_DN56542_c0_g1_i1.p1  ORF type:complete len:472 (-),score=34.63 TRINITY_DN56542_c0_g1_i1:66-1457(-)